jgi:UPF0755 protein
MVFDNTSTDEKGKRRIAKNKNGPNLDELLYLIITTIVLSAIGVITIFIANNLSYTKSFMDDLYFHRVKYNPPKTVIIRNNMSLNSIAKTLEDEGITASTSRFIRYFASGSHQLHPGVYLFKNNLKGKEAITYFDHYKEHLDPKYTLNLYTATNPVTVYSRLIEISQCEECIQRFVADKQLPGNSLYGLIDQNVYYLYPNFNVYQFLEKNTRKWVSFAASGQSLAISPAIHLNAYELMVAASLIQAEGDGNMETSKNIASVIFNRLNQNMPLTFDSTVFFATQRYGYMLPNDKNTPSPYNTYVSKGLPPTPITWISPPALNAAMNPAHTNYLYFYGERGKPYWFTNSKTDFDKFVAAQK